MSINYHIIYINALTPPVDDLWEDCPLPDNIKAWAETNGISDRDLLLGKLTRRFSEFLPMNDVLQAVARIHMQLPKGSVTGTLMVIRHNQDNNTRI